MASFPRSNREKWSCALALAGLCTVLSGGIHPARFTWPVAQAQEVTRTPQTVVGELTTNSPVWEEDGGYYETHTFAGTAGEAITIELTSDDFDAFLILQDPAGEVMAEDDNGIGDTNSRITTTLPASGTYTLIVKTTYSTNIGPYLLERRPATDIEQELAQAAQLDKQGEELIQAGNYEEAEALFQQALEIRQQLLASDDLSVARSFMFLGLVHQAQGYFEEAETFFKEALAINQDKLGFGHSVTAANLNLLALSYQAQEQYAEAESLYQKALEINQQELGPSHPETVANLELLAALYQAQGRYRESEPLYQRALAINQQQLGASHINTAQSLNNLAVQYYYQGRYEQAETLLQQALAIYEAALGPDHPYTAQSINNLALIYQAQGRYEQAEPLYRQALAINQQLNPNHINTALNLNNLAELYRSQGRYEQAEALLEQALEINQQHFGLNHPQTATSLNNFGLLYQTKGFYAEAESFYQQALRINQQQLGPSHPQIAVNLSNLALLYVKQGFYAEAEPLYRQALEIYEKSFERNHRDTARTMNNLAELHRLQGRFDAAESLLEQALEIRKNSLGLNHPDVAQSLNNLALVYRAQNRVEESETLFLRAIRIYEVSFGTEHSDLAASLNNLAALYRSTSRFEEAEVLLHRALEINQESLGLVHPDTAQVLNSLGLLHSSQGYYNKAESFYQQALQIREETLGTGHPDTAISLNNLTIIYQAQGQNQLALTYLSQSLASQEASMSRNLVSGSDKSKRDYLSTVTGRTNAAISFHLNEMSADPETSQLLFSTIIQRKGRILDLFTNLRAQLKDDPAAIAVLDELSTINAQLSALNSNPPIASSEKVAHEAQLTTLQNRSHDLEDQLSRLSINFADLARSPSLVEIHAALPKDSALVEFVRYIPFDPTVNQEECSCEARYAAYMLHQNGDVKGVDLGSAKEIESAVEIFSTSLASPNTPSFQISESAQQLYDLVMAPVTEALGETSTVFISPDGALNLISFEALMNESGQYLVETYQFRYLTSGRDLMRLNNAANTATNPALLVGNPTYGRPGELVAQTSTRAIDFDNRVFPALPGTQTEIDRIASLLPDAEVYTQTNATEAVVKEQNQPSILHIATHGFFEPDTETLNPLLQSGLILAGAAAGGQSGPDQDGILTALEVTGMNLQGTQLVVLSACETGLGEVTTGEGIYGLRRAFVLAGTQTQVISLWKVDDTATQELMVDYYDRLLSGTPRDAALRKTQLAFLESDNYSHPYYWAAFIGSGDWRPLQQ